MKQKLPEENCCQGDDEEFHENRDITDALLLQIKPQI